MKIGLGYSLLKTSKHRKTHTVNKHERLCNFSKSLGIPCRDHATM